MIENVDGVDSNDHQTYSASSNDAKQPVMPSVDGLPQYQKYDDSGIQMTPVTFNDYVE